MLHSGFIEKLIVDFILVGIFAIIDLFRYLLWLAICKQRCVNIGAIFRQVGDLEPTF